MIHLAPFEDIAEHRTFCTMAKLDFEEESIGFKIFSDEDPLGLCQIKFVGEAAYILGICSIEDRISTQMLANVFSSILAFLERVEVESVIFPIQDADDIMIAEANGFDRISETLYVYDFPEDQCEHGEHCDCSHHH